jgi:FkbM family methyltransferase
VPGWKSWLQNRRPWSDPSAGLTAIATQVEELQRANATEMQALRDAMTSEIARLRDEFATTRDAIWASKALNVGDRLLVGSRHLNLVFYIDPDDRLIGPRFVVEGEYEPATTKFVLQHVGPDDTCIDVGANFGYYSCLLAHLAWRGRVLAYEADPLMHRTLVDNVAINWAEAVVQPINAAIGDTHGQLTLHRWINRAGNTGIIAPTHEIAPGFALKSETFDVEMLPLDSLVDQMERLDLVKIDVEGAESLVVKGMAKLVDRFRPIVIMEWSPYQIDAAGSSTDELARLLEGLNLPVHTIRPDGTLEPIDFQTLRSLSFQNVVLAPPGRIGS